MQTERETALGIIIPNKPNHLQRAGEHRGLYEEEAPRNYDAPATFYLNTRWQNEIIPRVRWLALSAPEMMSNSGR